ncbi:MAG TPA: glycosyltransferase family 2 protein [Solirubrobacteraceae bacterium]|nr:glycosyltransferase family 2 protein [Solirubrobacteraceae bacterium]
MAPTDVSEGELQKAAGDDEHGAHVAAEPWAPAAPVKPGTRRHRRRDKRRADGPRTLELVPPLVVPEPVAVPAIKPFAPHQSRAVLSSAQKAVHVVLIAGWVGVLAKFWAWWLVDVPPRSAWLYWLQTVAMLYDTTILPSLVWYVVFRMRRPVPVSARPGMKVALVTLCVPSHESLEVIKAQLRALAEVSYPHDSWVLDEGRSRAVRAYAQSLGVRYFSRRDVPHWNTSGAPFKARTKSGNVNAWLDHVKSQGLNYDVFVQYDIDHRPDTDYLDVVLGYFEDPKVAWVQAPSVYGNLDNWTARGAAEQDLLFQGPLQMGFYGAAQTPLILGSHTSYRTNAIREIGGFQNSRAEDHLDTVTLAANGYRGVFVPEVIAVGDGPEDLRTYLAQQYAWSYSMTQIMVQHMPRLIRRLRPRQALVFLMCQSWYVLFSVSMVMLWALPGIALLSNSTAARISFGTFLLYFVPIPLYIGAMWFVVRRWAQPHGLRMSWRGLLLNFARCWIVMWSVLIGLTGRKRGYMITRKGTSGGHRGWSSSYGLYVVLAVLPLAVIGVAELFVRGRVTHGYLLFALLDSAFAVLVLTADVVSEIRQRACGLRNTLSSMRARVVPILTVLLLMGLLSGSCVVASAQIAKAISS